MNFESYPNNPPDCPLWIEPHTHFETRHNCLEIMKQLINAMSSGSCRFLVDFEQTRFSILRGIVYDASYEYATFHLNIYQKPSHEDDDRNGCLVELQRQAGCGFVFRDFYTHLKRECGERTLSELPFRFNTQGISWNPSVLNEVMTFVSSEYLEQSREGMRLLRFCSLDRNNIPLLLNYFSELYSVLSRSLQSGDFSSIHCSSVILERVVLSGITSEEFDDFMSLSAQLRGPIQKIMEIQEIEYLDIKRHLISSLGVLNHHPSRLRSSKI